MLLNESLRIYNVKIVAYAVKETNVQHTNNSHKNIVKRAFLPLVLAKFF